MEGVLGVSIFWFFVSCDFFMYQTKATKKLCKILTIQWLPNCTLAHNLLQCGPPKTGAHQYNKVIQGGCHYTTLHMRVLVDSEESQSNTGTNRHLSRTAGNMIKGFQTWITILFPIGTVKDQMAVYGGQKRHDVNTDYQQHQIISLLYLIQYAMGNKPQ